MTRETAVKDYVKLWLGPLGPMTPEFQSEERRLRELCNFTAEEHALIHYAIRAANEQELENAWMEVVR